MEARQVLGVVVGIAALFASFWFSFDAMMALGARVGDRSALTQIVIVIFSIVAAIQVASLVGWGRWAEDDSWPKERSWMLLAGLAVVFVLSVVSY